MSQNGIKGHQSILVIFSKGGLVTYISVSLCYKKEKDMKPKRAKDMDSYRKKLKRDEEIEAGMYNKPGHQVHKGKKDYSRKNKKDWERDDGDE